MSRSLSDTPLTLHQSRLLFFLSGGIWGVWVALNFLLVVEASMMDVTESRWLAFYPLNTGETLGLWAYDVSEFVVYALVLPVWLCLYLKNRLWDRQNRLRRKTLMFAVLWMLAGSGMMVLTYVGIPGILQTYVYTVGLVIALAVIFSVGRSISRRPVR